MKYNYEQRFRQYEKQLHSLYSGLYHNEEAYAYFCEMLHKCADARKSDLRRIDEARLEKPDWYRGNDRMGMMMYPAAFGGDLQGVREKLSYLDELGINYLHLMPLLDSPKEKSDGGYAVSDFRKVRPDLGNMDDLEALADACHEQGMVLCLDFVMNHTSDEHPWAKAARAGDPVARSRYFFFDNWDTPNQYEQTVPQVFPTTAPGNFSWLEDCSQIVMTSFYPFQWDLNYSNPMVLNDMTENLLFLANRGMDVVRLDAVPYIWKQLGTDCRNLPQVHTLVRILRLACQIVCPGVLILGEVVMEPAKVAPYFGTGEAPECHMLYNVTTMCTTWHTLATRDTRLLRMQMEKLTALPTEFLFQNYLRCHDDIGWGLDYSWLNRLGMEESHHKKYLNDWFTGIWPGSWSRGELYNDDPRLKDARLCGTCASLTGLETAKTETELNRAISCNLMLHAWMLTQSGIPVLYSGDEIGQLNDSSYHMDPDKREDSRFLHRGDFLWEKVPNRKDRSSVEGKLFSGMQKLICLRKANPVFHGRAQVEVVHLQNNAILQIVRSYKGQRLTALFNFSERNQTLDNPIFGGVDVYTGMKMNQIDRMKGYEFLWILQEE